MDMINIVNYNNLLSILNILFMMTSLIIIFSLIKSRYGVFNIIVIYLSLSIIDVNIPIILWDTYGYHKTPYWVSALDTEDFIIGLLNYYIFYLIMIIVFIVFTKKKYINWSNSYQFKIDKEYINRRLFILLIVSGFLYALSLLYSIFLQGSYDAFILNRFTVRYTGEAPLNNEILNIILVKIPWRSIFDSLVFLAFLFRFKHNKQKLYGFVFPFIAILFSLTTSYRGSILILLLGFVFIELARINMHKYNNYSSKFGTGKETLHKLKYYLLAFLIPGLFILYGAIRDTYATEKLGYEQQKESTIYRVLSQGSGIESISSIIKHYGNDVDFLMGKTYIDMLLLPIPRTIYTSKPNWYGISDITIGMGWPASTQSAVTIPGEAYANFGWFGLFIAIIYGLFFALIINHINKKGGVWLIMYPSVILFLIFISNWMAFTGIMNLFFHAFFILLFLSFVFIRFTWPKSQIN